MAKLNSPSRLQETILELERKRIAEGKLLKVQLQDTVESLKPINLIKSTFIEATGSPELKGNLVNTSVGLTIGFLSKVIFEGSSKSPFKKLIGSALLFGITNIVTRNPKTMQKIGSMVMNVIRPKHKDERVNGVPHPVTPARFSLDK